MKKQIQIKPTKELAYLIGIIQTDGSFKKYIEKSRNVKRWIISMCVGKKSLPMLRKFQKLSKKLLNRKGGIFKSKISNEWESKIRVNSLIKEFERLDINFGDPPTPPFWVKENEKLFGAYLAGIIDGDGNVRIKRKKYPQCAVRITSSEKQIDLKSTIEKILRCKVNITKDENAYDLEFYVSPKNYKIIKENVLPYITLKYKKDKLNSYINSRWPSWRSPVSAQAK